MAAGVDAESFGFERAGPCLGGCWSLAHQVFRDRRIKVLTYAGEVLGNRRLAEEWFARGAIGLGHRSPCSLLAHLRGYELVMEHLQRLDYGVYC